MPVLKILHVCSSSSEKPVSSFFTARIFSMASFPPHLPPLQKQPAENLLDLESYKKWSCAEPGEKKATVVLQVSSPAASQLLYWCLPKHEGVHLLE